MGVSASFCRVCALPLHHDHYVPMADGMLKIFRSGREGAGQTWDDDEKPVAFGPEHAWLTDAVAISIYGDEPAFARGEVHDGGLIDDELGEELFVGDSDEEHLLLHAACWERAGKPKSAAEVPVVVDTPAWALVAPYHEQLFDFRRFIDDGKDWMLVDPSGSTDAAVQNRARIDASITAARGSGD